MQQYFNKTVIFNLNEIAGVAGLGIIFWVVYPKAWCYKHAISILMARWSGCVSSWARWNNLARLIQIIVIPELNVQDYTHNWNIEICIQAHYLM